MAAAQKLSCRHLVGPSVPRPTLFCFGLVWSNHVGGKIYPEMDIRETVKQAVFRNDSRLAKGERTFEEDLSLEFQIGVDLSTSVTPV